MSIIEATLSILAAIEIVLVDILRLARFTASLPRR
jgi:hypothetical protein